MDKLYTCQASAAFGLEGLVSRELKQSGIQDVRADNGFVRFSATGDELYLCNLRMHYSDRLYIILASLVPSANSGKMHGSSKEALPLAIYSSR